MRPPRKKSVLFPVLLILLGSQASQGQTLDPVLPRVSPSEQALDAIRRQQGDEGRRALQNEQFRFDTNAIRSRELFERAMPAQPPAPCAPGDPACR